MLKIYSYLFLLLVVCCSSSVSFAQVSVVATAGHTGPIPYSSLKAAFDAINEGIHKGEITLTVNSNIIETSSAIIKASFVGTASYTSVLIKPGAGTNPVISGAVANSLIILDGAQNVTIDGSNTTGGSTKDLTISNESPSGSSIVFLNGASSNAIKNSIIRSAVTNSGVVVLSTSTAQGGNNNNTIANNDITGTTNGSPFIGIFNTGTDGKPNTGNTYRNNRIFNFLYFGFSDGGEIDKVGFSENTLVEGNEFFNTSPSNSNIIALFINNATGTSNMIISKNRIHSLTATGPFEGVIGIMVYEAASVTIVNNMISLADDHYELRGISQEASAGAIIKIYNNTILISGATSGAIRSFCLFKNWFSTGDDIRNNMFINTRVSSGTGRQYAFIKIQPGTFTSDYNNLVSTGNENNYVGGVGVTDAPALYKTFAEWQAGAGQDAHSISVNPAFISTTDLHLNPAGNPDIDNKGTPLTEVTTDIDGEVRSTTAPDMGIDEFASTTTAVSVIDPHISSVVLMPNVVNNAAVLRVRSARVKKISWTIVDMNGNVVLAFSSNVRAGVNDIELKLAGFSTGIYLIEGKTLKGRTEVIRLVKL